MGRNASMHLILGNGNLGRSLANQLAQRGLSYKLLDKSEFCYPKNELVVPGGTRYLWNTIGAGSVEFAKNNPQATVDAHVSLPLYLCKTLPPGVRLILFSSDYAEKVPRSIYAVSKIAMEQAVGLLGRPKTSIVRVGSLYGPYFPHKTFPGKIRARYKNADHATFPQNLVRPTPTEWLADHLIKTVNTLFGIGVRPVIKDVCPRDQVSVADWARVVLPNMKIYESGYDTERPVSSFLTHPPFVEDWLTLWERHKI